MTILSKLGLMRVSEHNSRVVRSFAELTEEKEKLKRATTNLAAQVEVSRTLTSSNRELRAELASLRPDAEAMRAKRKRDRDYQRAKATGQSVVQSDNGGGV